MWLGNSCCRDLSLEQRLCFTTRLSTAHIKCFVFEILCSPSLRAFFMALRLDPRRAGPEEEDMGWEVGCHYEGSSWPQRFEKFGNLAGQMKVMILRIAVKEAVSDMMSKDRKSVV